MQFTDTYRQATFTVIKIRPADIKVFANYINFLTMIFFILKLAYKQDNLKIGVFILILINDLVRTFCEPPLNAIMMSQVLSDKHCMSGVMEVNILLINDI